MDRRQEFDMYRFASAMLLVVVCGLAAYAQPQPYRGQVINRDGAPQQCQVEFWSNQAQPTYRLVTDRQGYFYLPSPPEHGTYRVVVVLGNLRQEFDKVQINHEGLHPPTFVVNW